MAYKQNPLPDVLPALLVALRSSHWYRLWSCPLLNLLASLVQMDTPPLFPTSSFSSPRHHLKHKTLITIRSYTNNNKKLTIILAINYNRCVTNGLITQSEFLKSKEHWSGEVDLNSVYTKYIPRIPNHPKTKKKQKKKRKKKKKKPTMHH